MKAAKKNLKTYGNFSTQKLYLKSTLPFESKLAFFYYLGKMMNRFINLNMVRNKMCS